jgi:folylpolyglutamate synthase
MSNRSYKDAIDLLNTLQSNAATLDAIRASGGQTQALAIPEMIEYLEGIGHKVRCCSIDKYQGSTSASARRS